MRVLAEREGGRDPQAERQAKKLEVMSQRVEDLVDDFINRHVSQNRSASETIRILRREVLPDFGTRAVSELCRADVDRLIHNIQARGAPIMANRAFAAIRKFLAWCVGRGILENSPCEGMRAPSKERSRERVLSDEELKSILVAARTMGHPFGSIVQVLGLTGQRRNEVGLMTWAQLDLSNGQWVIPAERAKNGKSHVVHLSEEAKALISSSPRLGDLVFSNDGKRPFQGYSKCKSRLDQVSGINNWTLHDLRRTVVSGMARLGIPPHVADKILNHQSGSIGGVAAIYQRHEFLDERRDALEIWGRHVAALLGIAEHAA